MQKLQKKIDDIRKRPTFYIIGVLIILIIYIADFSESIDVILEKFHSFFADTEQEKFDSVYIGSSRSNIEANFGNSIQSGIYLETELNKEIEYYTYESKNAYLTSFYDENKLVAFFVFLKGDKSLDMSYSFFEKKLGDITFADIPSPSDQIVVDISTGNMGLGTYSEYYGTGRWGKYYTYVLGETTMVPSNYHNYKFLMSIELGEAGIHNRTWNKLLNSEFAKEREKVKANFCGVIEMDYNIIFPNLDCYLAIDAKNN